MPAQKGSASRSIHPTTVSRKQGLFRAERVSVRSIIARVLTLLLLPLQASRRWFLKWVFRPVKRAWNWIFGPVKTLIAVLMLLLSVLSYLFFLTEVVLLILKVPTSPGVPYVIRAWFEVHALGATWGSTASSIAINMAQNMLTYSIRERFPKMTWTHWKRSMLISSGSITVGVIAALMSSYLALHLPGWYLAWAGVPKDQQVPVGDFLVIVVPATTNSLVWLFEYLMFGILGRKPKIKEFVDGLQQEQIPELLLLVIQRLTTEQIEKLVIILQWMLSHSLSSGLSKPAGSDEEGPTVDTDAAPPPPQGSGEPNTQQ